MLWFSSTMQLDVQAETTNFSFQDPYDLLCDWVAKRVGVRVGKGTKEQLDNLTFLTHEGSISEIRDKREIIVWLILSEV